MAEKTIEESNSIFIEDRKQFGVSGHFGSGFSILGIMEEFVLLDVLHPVMKNIPVRSKIKFILLLKLKIAF